MNPESNRFEFLSKAPEGFFKNKIDELENKATLLRPNGEPVPKHWSIFKIGEEIIIKDYTFKVAYINESSIIFEPVAPKTINTQEKKLNESTL